MKRDSDEILKAALALSSEARAALARALLEKRTPFAAVVESRERDRRPGERATY